MTEERLMQAYVAGDRRAFERLFALVAPPIHGFFMRSFHSRAVADDLLQTTFLKVHRARDQYAQDRPLRPWLFAIAARVRVDELRSKQRTVAHDAEVALQAEESSSSPSIVDADSERSNLALQVRAAIDELPEPQRVVLLLHRYQELSFAEIAEALGSTEGAVKVRASRAYAELRLRLRHVLDGEEAA